LIKATGLPVSCFSTSCFTGIYPSDIGERKLEIKKKKVGLSAQTSSSTHDPDKV